ncbi:MAG: radical SAM family heme chaperone HemW [Bacteroidales bacterium]|nr:radical SAM family heme chaperone HemW [Bacteroidales bacterium]
MAGIYIHIPFCRQKCHYCNFFSVASRKEMPAVVHAICREAELQQSYLEGKTIETIYFGGGTPSMLEPEFLTLLMETIRRFYTVHEQTEITLEANPDDISEQSLHGWKKSGINRLSIGIQSFHNEDLLYLNRVHNAEKARQCLTLARDAGFDNLTLDLIFGIPTLSDEGWIENINTACEMGIPHISAYALTIEPKTALDLMIRKGKAAPVDEHRTARQFEMLMNAMKEKGFLHYEISNFCKPGHFARHNTAYWQGTSYLGLGPSAHSYNGQTRQWNVSGIGEYLGSVSRNAFPEGSEELTPGQKYDEYVMTGLRTMWGCNAGEILLKFGREYYDLFSSNTEAWLAIKYMECNGDQYTLTLKGKMLADRIASDLFIGED